MGGAFSATLERVRCAWAAQAWQAQAFHFPSTTNVGHPTLHSPPQAELAAAQRRLQDAEAAASSNTAQPATVCACEPPAASPPPAAEPGGSGHEGGAGALAAAVAGREEAGATPVPWGLPMLRVVRAGRGEGQGEGQGMALWTACSILMAATQRLLKH